MSFREFGILRSMGARGVKVFLVALGDGILAADTGYVLSFACVKGTEYSHE